jgi:hypothetical protein
VLEKLRRVVYNDINDSTYYLDVGKARLYFSSEFNKTRFLKNYSLYTLEECKKIENKYHVKINANYYLLFAFYKKIEKRGFRIENNITGKRINENLTFIVEL